MVEQVACDLQHYTGDMGFDNTHVVDIEDTAFVDNYRDVEDEEVEAAKCQDTDTVSESRYFVLGLAVEGPP